MDFSSLQDSRRQQRIPAINYNIGMQSQKTAPVELNRAGSNVPPTSPYSILINDGTNTSVSQHHYNISKSSFTSKQWVQSAFGDVLRNGGKSGCSVCGGKK